MPQNRFSMSSLIIRPNSHYKTHFLRGLTGSYNERGLYFHASGHYGCHSIITVLRFTSVRNYGNLVIYYIAYIPVCLYSYINS